MSENDSGRRRRLLRFMQKIRVPAGFILAPMLLIVARPSTASILLGGIIAIAGLAIRGWASGHLRKNEHLTTSGPYSRTRNPLYFGTFIMGTGIAVSSGTMWFVGLFATLYLVIYIPVMMAEADTMRALFPAEYEPYSRQVPLFFPSFAGYGSGREGRFTLDLYLKHREYRAMLGVGVVLSLMVARLLILR